MENLKQIKVWLDSKLPGETINSEEWEVAQKQIRDALKSFSDLLDELGPYREAAEESEKERLRMERLDDIVKLLFPRYDARWCDRHPEDKPPIHPERAWWWNGAKLDDMEERGEWLHLEVSSYTGGGNTDDFTAKVPAKWLTTATLKEDVHGWIREETERVRAEERIQAVANAQAELARLKAKIANLGGEGQKLGGHP